LEGEKRLAKLKWDACGKLGLSLRGLFVAECCVGRCSFEVAIKKKGHILGTL